MPELFHRPGNNRPSAPGSGTRPPRALSADNVVSRDETDGWWCVTFYEGRDCTEYLGTECQSDGKGKECSAMGFRPDVRSLSWEPAPGRTLHVGHGEKCGTPGQQIDGAGCHNFMANVVPIKSYKVD